MKDQFANYVVQKVLETCDDQQLELILNRIKVHLNALKKYTYGKHIVARVEKLVAAGGTFPTPPHPVSFFVLYITFFPALKKVFIPFCKVLVAAFFFLHPYSFSFVRCLAIG